MNESSLLPTSGSRGCTSTVVELNFNRDLLPSDSDIHTNVHVPVYRAEIELISKEDWFDELSTLLEDCTENGFIFKSKTGAASWSKIEEVYGKAKMNGFLGQATTQVLT